MLQQLTKLIVLYSRLRVKIACPLDFRNFPMDEQKCLLNLESCKCAIIFAVDDK